MSRPEGLTPEEERIRQMVPLLTSVSRRLRQRRDRVRRRPSHAEQEQAIGGKSGAFRAAIFGVSDGLVSNLSLIMGVAGAGVSNEFILLAGLAGLLAGAFSMGAGEYVSMRAQREVFERLIHLERQELAAFPEAERHELASIYRQKGVPRELAVQLAQAISEDPETALDTHAREELGLDPEEGLGSPWGATFASFFTFGFGAFVPIVPFLFGSGTAATITAAAVSGLTLFAVGAGISLLTGKRFYLSGLRQVLVGAAAAAITFGVGSLLNVNTTG